MTFVDPALGAREPAAAHNRSPPCEARACPSAGFAVGLAISAPQPSAQPAGRRPRGMARSTVPTGEAVPLLLRRLAALTASWDVNPALDRWAARRAASPSPAMVCALALRIHTAPSCWRCRQLPESVESTGISPPQLPPSLPACACLQAHLHHVWHHHAGPRHPHVAAGRLGRHRTDGCPGPLPPRLCAGTVRARRCLLGACRHVQSTFSGTPHTAQPPHLPSRTAHPHPYTPLSDSHPPRPVPCAGICRGKGHAATPPPYACCSSCWDTACLCSPPWTRCMA